MLYPHLQKDHPKFSPVHEVLALLPTFPNYALEEDLTRDIFGTRNSSTRHQMHKLLAKMARQFVGLNLLRHRTGEYRISLQRKHRDDLRLVAEDYLDSLDP